MAAICCLTDAILLASVSDHPSLFCQHYAGRAGGPTHAFGFDLGAYAEESANSPLFSPVLAFARPRILMYASTRVSQLQPGHAIFDFGYSMRPQPADLKFTSQLALSVGLPSTPHLGYIAGSPPDLVEAVPELTLRTLPPRGEIQNYIPTVVYL